MILWAFSGIIARESVEDHRHWSFSAAGDSLVIPEVIMFDILIINLIFYDLSIMKTVDLRVLNNIYK